MARVVRLRTSAAASPPMGRWDGSWQAEILSKPTDRKSPQQDFYRENLP
jgi:hypothetical protein